VLNASLQPLFCSVVLLSANKTAFLYKLFFVVVLFLQFEYLC